MAKSIPPATVKAMLSDGDEIALLDVREAGQYADGHPFFAVPLAYSGFEADVERLVPRRAVRMSVVGDGLSPDNRNCIPKEARRQTSLRGCREKCRWLPRRWT